MSPVCQDGYHPCREDEATESMGWRRCAPLRRLCFRRRYLHWIGTMLVEGYGWCW